MGYYSSSPTGRRDKRAPPHVRYDSDTSWHAEVTLPDGVSIGKMGAYWYILDEDGVPLPMKNSSFNFDENGFQSIKKVDDGYIVNSRGSIGDWGRVRISNGGLSVVNSFEGKPPIGDVALGGKAFRRSLHRLGVLPLPEYLQLWAKRGLWGFIPISLLTMVLSMSLSGFLFIALPVLSVLMYIAGTILRVASSEQMWEWDTPR